MLKATAPFLTIFDRHWHTTSEQTQPSEQWGLKQWWEQFVSQFSGTQDPQITEFLGRDGQVLWAVYDPVTNYREVFASEQAVRVWLEQRYYQ